MCAGAQGRTIFLSDSAVVARRDGDLKFMFRIADIRPRYQVQVCFFTLLKNAAKERYACRERRVNASAKSASSWHAPQHLQCVGRGLYTLPATDVQRVESSLRLLKLRCMHGSYCMVTGICQSKGI